MSTIVTRSGKGSPLTHNEVDANFTNLNSDKTENSAAAITGGSINNTIIGNTTPNAATFTTLTATGQTSLGGAAGNDVFRVLRDNTFAATTVASFTAPQFSFIPPQNGFGAAVIGLGLNPRINSYGTDGQYFATNQAAGFSGTVQAKIQHTASAVNYVQVTGAPTTGLPTISAQGSDSVVSLLLRSKGTANTVIQNDNAAFFQNLSGASQFRVSSTASAVNYLSVTGSAAGASPAMSVVGSDTNIGLNLTTKGTGAVSLQTGNGTVLQAIDRGGTQDSPFIFRAGLAGTQGGRLTLPVSTTITAADASLISFATNAGVEQFRVSNTASAVNYVQVTGAATGGRTVLSAQGSDTNIGIALQTKGSGFIYFQNVNAGAGFVVSAPIGASANCLQSTGSAAGSAPVLSSTGSDTNIDLALTPKGTGLVRFGTYTASMALTVQGYIEIKDSGGTVRKLAVIA